MSTLKRLMSSHLDIWFGGALFAVALLIRLFFVAHIVFPPLDDPAFYIQSARNVAVGQGLVMDVVWTQFVPFASVVHPSHEFWMPIATLAIAAFIRLFGDTLFVEQLAGVLAGASLPVITYAIGCWMWPNQRRWSVLAAAFILPSAILVYQSASSDSTALYAMLTAGALWTAAVAIEKRSVRWSIIGGLLCGLSYLTRSHGSLIPIGVLAVGAVSLRHDRKQFAKMLIAGALTYFIAVIPWWLRNITAFGTIQPIPLTTIAAATDYSQWFNYTNLPTLSNLMAQGLPAIIGVRLDALMNEFTVWLSITFPFGLLGLPIVFARREAIFRVMTAYAVILFGAVWLVLPTSSGSGSFYHSSGMLAIWAALGCVIAIRHWFVRQHTRLLAVALYMACISLVIGQAAIAWPKVFADSQANSIKFADVAKWLGANVPSDQTLMTTEAHSLKYASGYSTVTLPYGQDVSVLRQMADRYQIRYIVVMDSVGLYPDALNQAGVKLAANVSGALIYDLTP